MENDWYKRYEEHFDKEMKKSNALPDGLQKGKIFRIQVADGFAYYEITKVNKLTVIIKWREDLSLDSYQDRVLGVGGKIDKNRIENIVIWQEKWNKIRSK